MSQELETAYLSAIARWSALRSAELPGTPALSAPLVVELPPGYDSSRVRVMIVGQESFGWGESLDYNKKADETLDTLKFWYRDFDRGARYRATPFWQAAGQIYSALNPGSDSRAFLWSNLYKMDVGGRRPSAEREREIDDAHLLQLEVAEWKPQVVVFFTGPQYDDRLLRCFPGATIVQLARALARVTHPDLPSLAFRTYHPKYLRLSRQWATLSTIASLCEEGST
jgi:hypothetical protein